MIDVFCCYCVFQMVDFFFCYVSNNLVSLSSNHFISLIGDDSDDDYKDVFFTMIDIYFLFVFKILYMCVDKNLSSV